MRKVLWAVNPFEEEKQFAKASLSQIRKTLGPDAEITPCFVLIGGQLDYQALGQNLINEEEYRASAAQGLSERAKGWKDVAAPVMLPKLARSQGEAVDLFSAYAEEHGYDLVALSSHGRSGVARLFLGSFAESLVLKSQTPVMVLRPQSKAKKLKTILLATDFSPESKKLFRFVTNWAKGVKAKVVVFHQFQDVSTLALSPGVFPSSAGGFTDVHGWLKEERRAIEKVSDAWAVEAKSAGVKAEFVHVREKRALDEEIARQAKKLEADLVVMEGESGAVESVLLGSVCRKVVRSSPVPVLVVRRARLNAMPLANES